LALGKGLNEALQIMLGLWPHSGMHTALRPCQTSHYVWCYDKKSSIEHTITRITICRWVALVMGGANDENDDIASAARHFMSDFANSETTQLNQAHTQISTIHDREFFWCMTIYEHM
jgi:hypothetical protein